MNVRGFSFYGRITVKTVFLSALIFVATFAAAQKVDPIGKPDVPPAFAGALQDHGLRVLAQDGTALVSLWLAKSVKTSAKEVEGANYPQLDPSSFVGAIRFEAEGKDFRAQTIPKGTYTLRYALLPNDGNHMGVAPNRDFLLLVPLATDTDPTTVYTEKQLHRASAKVAGGAHPTILCLVADDGKPGTATLSSEGLVVLHLSLTTSSGELPAALVVKGVAQQ